MATANRLTSRPLVHRLVIHPFVFRVIFTSFATTRFASQTRLLGADDWLFFNYGYEEDPPMGIPLDEADEPHRYFIQLYHRTATQVDLAGKKVLECSCGHGGGASYLVRTAHPASYPGLDLNPAGHRVRQEPAPPGQPGFRGGQCPGSAVHRRVVRRAGQRGGLAPLPRCPEIPVRSGTGAASGRAFPLHRLPSAVRSRRVGSGAGQLVAAADLHVGHRPECAARQREERASQARTDQPARRGNQPDLCPLRQRHDRLGRSTARCAAASTPTACTCSPRTRSAPVR